MKQNNEQMRSLLEAAMPELLMLKDLMDANDIDTTDVMRTLYLVANIKKLTQWGRVIITLKNGNITHVAQEQQFLSDKELSRIK